MNFDGCCGVAQALRATVVRWVLAVLCVVGVLSVIVWRVRNLGKKPEKDALKDLIKP